MNRHGERMALFHNRVFMVCLLAALLCLGPRPAAAVTEPASGKVAREASYGALPLLFIPNQGQYDPRVAFAVQGRDKSIFFTNEGLTFVLSESADSPPAGKPRALRDLVPHEPGPPMPQQRWTIKLDFVDANPEARPESLEQAGTVISYFKGRPEEWRTGLQASGKIIYRDLWPGIDLIYSGTVHRLKYDFIVHPGADPARIRLSCRGADGVAVTPSGEMELTTPLGALRDEMPKAWQERVDGRQEDVAVAYALNGPAGVEVAALTPDQGGAIPPRLDPDQHRQVYGFTVGDYDRSRTLVLDPEMLVYCGFLGGSGTDRGNGIAVDSAGQAYVTGSTTSTQGTFPETVGPDLSHNGGGEDAFVAKVRADGTGLVYCGFLGGSGEDYGNGIAVDGAGYAYITGETSSTEATFPATGSLDSTHNGGTDAFVAMVWVNGTGLVYCGYIGGSGEDAGNGIDVDSDENVYIIGSTTSTEATFPEKVGPDLIHNGSYDAFVAKINRIAVLVYCGYIGGSSSDYGSGIAVDSAGNAYVTGSTFSSGTTFPDKVGPDQSYNEGLDAFVAKVGSDGEELTYCGYIGGSSVDRGDGIAVDSGGNAYVTGTTASTQTTFPEKVGPDLTHNGGGEDAFVAKVRADGETLIYCGFIGGSGPDYGSSIAVDSAGHAYVTGWAWSDQTTFPVAIGPDLTHNGDDDAYVAKVLADGSGLIYCGYLGGSEDDFGAGIAVDSAGNAYVTGSTSSTEATFPVTVGPDRTHNGEHPILMRQGRPIQTGIKCYKNSILKRKIL